MCLVAGELSSRNLHGSAGSRETVERRRWRLAGAMKCLVAEQPWGRRSLRLSVCLETLLEHPAYGGGDIATQLGLDRSPQLVDGSWLI